MGAEAPARTGLCGTMLRSSWAAIKQASGTSMLAAEVRSSELSMADLKVLLSRDQIAKRVAEMGEQIACDFQGQSIIFLGVLKGAAIFLSDLARNVPLDATFDFIGVSSYGNRPTPTENPAGHAAWDSSGEVRLTKDVDQALTGQNVVLVEDILDTGLTLNYIKKIVLA